MFETCIVLKSNSILSGVNLSFKNVPAGAGDDGAKWQNGVALA